MPYEEPFVLQPAVTLHVEAARSARILSSRTSRASRARRCCRQQACKAYYAPWYPNDGEIKEVGERVAEQELTVSDVALWTSRSMSWSAADPASGRYYSLSLSIRRTRSAHPDATDGVCDLGRRSGKYR